MTLSFRDGVLAQPDNLRRAAASMRETLAQADIGAMCDGTLVLSGIGASGHALVPAVLALRAAGRRAFAVSPAELRSKQAARLGDAFVLVSQSGASAETVEALERLDGAPVIAISARGDSPLARAATLWLPLGSASDTPVATLSYTATLQALGILCEAIVGNAERSRWERLPEIAADLFERFEREAESLAGEFEYVTALDAVGGGPALASAGETALLAREALQLPGTGMETREYLHGPLEAVGDGFACIVFGGVRERELAEAMASYGAHVVLITDGARDTSPGVTVVELPALGELAAPILQIMPVQLIVDHLARLRGLTIGDLRRPQQDTKVT
jgi:glucosamine--fructose-6-phosphate aminotransferase (isomerizing)